MADSYARQPRFWLEVEGARLPVLDAKAHTSRQQHADSFSVTLALYGMPEGYGPAYWAGAGTIKAALVGRNDEGESATTVVKGQVDQCELDFTEGTVRINGRDRTAEMLDKKNTRKYADRKSSEIVQEIAGDHGFETEIDDTDDKAGKIHVQEYAHLTDMQSDWDVVVALADREGKVPFVKGDTLYFKDPGEGGSEGALEVEFTPPSDGPAQGNPITLKCLRNGHLSKTVQAKVRSWNTRKKKAITVTKSYGASAEGADNNPLVYEYRAPNLTEAQADKIADKTLEENVAHEMVVCVEMPGDVTADARMDLQLTGTGTAFDQSFPIDTIEHHFDFEGGYTMTVTAKNKDRRRQKGN